MKNITRKIKGLGLVGLSVATATLANATPSYTAPDTSSISGYADTLMPALVTLGGVLLVAALGWVGFKFMATQGVKFLKSIGSK